jgi:hypothetical protein
MVAINIATVPSRTITPPMQTNLACDHRTDSEQGGEIEHVGADHDPGPNPSVMTGQRRHTRRDLRGVRR